MSKCRNKDAQNKYSVINMRYKYRNPAIKFI